MSEGWEQTTLGEVVSVKGGGTPATDKPNYWGGNIPWVTPKDMKSSEIGDSIDKITPAAIENSAASLLPSDAILVVVRSGILARTVPVAVTTRSLTVNQDIKALCPKPDVDARYLHYFMQMSEPEVLKLVTRGATVHRLSTDSLKALKFVKPPLPEQQRIVAILDEVFAGLATATANAEKNLKNARELFEIALITNIFGNADKQLWETTTVAKLALSEKGSIRTGPFGSQLLHSEFVDNGIAVLGIDNVVENEFRWGKNPFITPAKFTQLSRYQVRPGDVLITIMGTCGRCAIVPDDIPVAINTKHLCCISLDQTLCLPKFLHAYFLYHPIARTFLSEQAKGSIMAGLNMGIIERMPVRLPPITKQKSIIRKMDLLSKETWRLNVSYHKRIEMIYALKQSILQKAFSGELTAKAPSGAVSQRSNNVADAKRDTAVILALAYERHKRRNREKSLGHVKEQKILHMVEAEAEFDLGRRPIRDAAGPNDLKHMRAAEEWAEANHYFKVSERAKRGYQFQPLSRFQELLELANCIDPKVRTRIERVIDTFIPMDMQQAALFATIYAAWNNLLIEGRSSTDDEIIRAAREEWHIKKLEIPRSKFVEGLREVKRLNFIPTGRGRYVPAPAQAELLL